MRLTLHRAEIKQLRADARKLETVARHLRDRARDLAQEEKLTKAKADFFSKRSKVDPTVILQPRPFEDDEEVRT